MAKLLSQIAVIIRGSVGGLTFSASREHSITARARVGPARLSTNNQTLVRTCFIHAQGLWRILSDADRADWAAYAQTVDETGPLGTYNLTGLQMFIRTVTPILYFNRRGIAGLPESFIPPVLPGKPDIGPITPSNPVTVGTGIAVSVTNTTGIDGVAFIRVTGPWGVARLKNPGNWDTDRDLVVDCDEAASTLCEIMGLQEDAIYFMSVRMFTAMPPFRLDSEYVYRLIGEVIAA